MARTKKPVAKKLPMALAVHCKCGQPLGYFSPADDHSGVQMLCPKCSTLVYIANGALTEAIDFPEDPEHTHAHPRMTPIVAVPFNG